MKYVLLTLKYLPHVLNGVVVVDQTLAGAPGGVKKQVVMSAVQAAAQVGAQVPEEHVSVISALVDVVVGTLNQTGWFSHGTVKKEEVK